MKGFDINSLPLAEEADYFDVKQRLEYLLGEQIDERIVSEVFEKFKRLSHIYAIAGAHFSNEDLLRVFKETTGLEE